MDISTLEKGMGLLRKKLDLIKQRSFYTDYEIRLSIRSTYIDLSEEDQNTIRKIFVDRLQAQIDEVEKQIAEL